MSFIKVDLEGLCKAGSPIPSSWEQGTVGTLFKTRKGNQSKFHYFNLFSLLIAIVVHRYILFSEFFWQLLQTVDVSCEMWCDAISSPGFLQGLPGSVGTMEQYKRGGLKIRSVSDRADGGMRQVILRCKDNKSVRPEIRFADLEEIQVIETFGIWTWHVRQKKTRDLITTSILTPNFDMFCWNWSVASTPVTLTSWWRATIAWLATRRTHGKCHKTVFSVALWNRTKNLGEFGWIWHFPTTGRVSVKSAILENTEPLNRVISKVSFSKQIPNLVPERSCSTAHPTSARRSSCAFWIFLLSRSTVCCISDCCISWIGIAHLFYHRHLVVIYAICVYICLYSYSQNVWFARDPAGWLQGKLKKRGSREEFGSS